MSVPVILGPLGDLRSRTFAFYPAIVGVEHNEWRLQRASWSEIQVVNIKTGIEVWVPRRAMGEISSVDGPVAIVGLLKELEYKEGALVPHHRRVIEMPRAVNGVQHLLRGSAHPFSHDASHETAHLAPVIAIRTETPQASPARRWIRGGVAAGMLACIAAGFVLRETPLGARYGFFRPVIRPIRFTHDDRYESIVARLGRPSSEQTLRTSAGSEYRRLWYSRRGLAIILTGDNYAGALNSSGQVIDAAFPALLQDISAPAFIAPSAAPSR